MESSFMLSNINNTGKQQMTKEKNPKKKDEKEARKNKDIKALLELTN